MNRRMPKEGSFGKFKQGRVLSARYRSITQISADEEGEI